MKIRALWVDDSATDGQILCRLLQSEFEGRGIEFSCLHAQTIEEAESVPLADFDVVLLDLALFPNHPRGSTTDKTVEVEIWQRRDTWKIIVVTGNEFRKEELRERCLINGAADFMTKQQVFDNPERLADAVLKILR